MKNKKPSERIEEVHRIYYKDKYDPAIKYVEENPKGAIEETEQSLKQKVEKMLEGMMWSEGKKLDYGQMKHNQALEEAKNKLKDL